jgi:hypothetical protein
MKDYTLSSLTKPITLPNIIITFQSQYAKLYFVLTERWKKLLNSSIRSDVALKELDARLRRSTTNHPLDPMHQ